VDKATIGERLRRALDAGNFDQALELAAAYGESVKNDLHSAATLDEKALIVDEASRFLQDRLHLARVMRSHIAAQLGIAVRTALYQDTAVPENHWQING
jgi:hypothetical protein